MVNEQRKAIIRRLLHSAHPVSGNVMGAELGISRVAVWKHIQSLERGGYRIECTSRGYRFLEPPDVPDQYLIDVPVVRITHLTSVGSTMDAARALYRSGEGPCLVTTDSQTAGKGRKGRAWISEPGGIYASLGFPPSLPVQYSSLYTLCGALLLSEVIEDLLAVPASCKWPNDVLIGSSKVAGFLTEIQGELDRPDVCILGVGINVENKIPKSLPSSSALSQHTGRGISKAVLIERFLTAYLKMLPRLSPAEVVSRVTARSPRLRGARIHVGEFRQAGTVENLNNDGSLTVKIGESRRRIHAGDSYRLQ